MVFSKVNFRFWPLFWPLFLLLLSPNVLYAFRLESRHAIFEFQMLDFVYIFALLLGGYAR